MDDPAIATQKLRILRLRQSAFECLPHESPHDADAAQVFLEARGQAAFLGLGLRIAFFDEGKEKQGQTEDDGQHDEGISRQPRMQQQHPDDGDNQQHRHAPHAGDMDGIELAHGFYVRRYALQQIARLILIVKREGQALHVVIEIVAQATTSPFGRLIGPLACHIARAALHERQGDEAQGVPRGQRQDAR